MSNRTRAPASSADSVDLSATLGLLASLTQYAEAGAVEPNTLAQAAQHALERHGDHVEVLVAVAKLQLATGQREEAAGVLGQAMRLFPGDSRVEQLMIDSGFSFRRRRESWEDGGPASVRTPPSLRSSADPTDPQSHVIAIAARAAPAATGSRGTPKPGSVRAQVASDAGDTIPPATPYTAGTPVLRPTVRMARVAPSSERHPERQPERQRWGREPFDSRPTLDSRPDRDSTPAAGSQVARPAGQRAATPRDLGVTPTSPLPKVREEAPRSRRAAAGNLKLLDPHDERRRLDRYELIGEIASGGMASVYLARLAGVAGFQRFFAIKRLHPHLADEQEFIDMFLDEARLAAGIHHPNVVPILEVGTSEAGYYLVMDYIEGDTLYGVLARAASAGPVPRPIVLRILLDTLQGLHAAHELTDADGNLVDLVHRDCSPQNILVGVDGSSRITDFGVARASSRLSTTRGITVKGKLAYLSPEQATGRALDRRSDLFGMGAILWECIAGRRLFRADSEGETLSRILVEPIPSLTAFAPDLPESVAEVVATALARDPDARFATAADMADALEHAVRMSETHELFIASPRDVGGYMRELFGADIGLRREAIRAWTIQSGEPADGPRSQAFRPRGAGSPAPPHAQPADAEPGSGAQADRPTPKEPSVRRAEEASSPSAKKTPPASSPPAEPEPSSSAEHDPPADERITSPADPAPEAAPQRPAPARGRMRLALALLILLALIAFALIAVRSLG